MKLLGLTWDHPRGYDPLVKTLPYFHEMYPEIEICWEKRSLTEFGNAPLGEFSEKYDLMIIDHPSIGEAIIENAIVRMDELIGMNTTSEISSEFVGLSLQSYRYKDALWALPVDAACQVSARRPDLLSTAPVTWGNVMQIAKRTAKEGGPKVAIPLDPTSCFCSFVTLYSNKGGIPYGEQAKLDKSQTTIVLEFLSDLYELVHPRSVELNPPEMLDMMSTTDEILYIPLIFGYSNYSRIGFRESPIIFENIPSAGLGPVGSILGGAGISISRHCPAPAIAAEYAEWITSSEVQKEQYFLVGGQPAHISAWENEKVNSLSKCFFTRTRSTIDNAFLRPRAAGFIDVQIESGKLIHEFLRNNLDAKMVANNMKVVVEKHML